MNLVLLDWVIISVVLLSMLFSIISGFMKECLSLINWFVAFAVAKFFYEPVANMHQLEFLQPNLRIPVAIIALFFASFIAGSVIIFFITRIMRKTDGAIGVTDRVLGMVFGALRGVFIVCAILAAFKMLFSLGLFSFIQKTPYWTNSLLIPELNKIVIWFFDKIDIQQILTAPLEGSAPADPVSDMASTVSGATGEIPQSAPSADAVPDALSGEDSEQDAE